MITRCPPATRSASTSTSRSARARCDYCDFATWTDRDHLVDELRRRLRRRPPRAAPARPARRRACSSGAARRRSSPPAQLGRDPRRDRAGARRRGHGRVQPGLGVDEARLAGVPGRRRQPAVVRRAVDGRPHVLAALGRTHDPANVERASTRRGRPGSTTFNLDLIYGAAGRVDRRLAATLDGALALAPATSARTRSRSSPGTPLGRAHRRRRASPAPDDDDQADEVRARRRAARRRRARVVRDLELGPARRTSAATTSSTGASDDYLAIGCAAHGHTDGRRWWNVRTPERYIAAIDDGARPRGRRASGSTMAPGPRRRWSLALRTRDGVTLERAVDADVARRVAAVLDELSELAVRVRSTGPAPPGGDPTAARPAHAGRAAARHRRHRAPAGRAGPRSPVPGGRLALGRLECQLRDPLRRHPRPGTAARHGPDRKAAILKAIVEEYIDTAQPVASQHDRPAPAASASRAPPSATT